MNAPLWIGWIELGREWEADLRAAGCGDPPATYKPMRFTTDTGIGVWEMCCFRDRSTLDVAAAKFGFPATTFSPVSAP